jgi:hypothetical protein
MRKFLILLLFFPLALSSQTKIVGVLSDSLGAPIPFAPIGLLSLPDSTLIQGTITDEAGTYLMERIRSGKYILKINVIGYKEKISEQILVDSVTNKETSLNVRLSSSSNELNQVSVSAIRRIVEFKNGNVTVNVENSPLAKGNTVYDLLSKLPGVTVADEVIQLKGKAGVIILIDGRVQELTNVQLLNQLRSMSAEVVEKIEVMKNPPVKYDASGTSGMINIKTKKTKLLGYNGMVYTSCSQGFYARGMAGASLNFKSKKVSLFTDLNYNYGFYQTKFEQNNKFTTDSSITNFNLASSSKDVNKGLNYKIGADWTIDKNSTLGFKITGGPGAFNAKNAGTNTVSLDNYVGFDHLNVLASTPDKWNINNYNINAEHYFDTLGTMLSFTSDLTKLSENINGDVQNIFRDKNDNQVLPSNIFKSNNVNHTDILASKLDFTKVCNPKTSFEMGAKISYINKANNYLFERKNNSSGDYFTDTALTNNYRYDEQTYAAYINYIKTFNKINFHLGVRGEYTTLNGTNTTKGFGIKREFLKLFPNVSVDYARSEKHDFQFNYNRRVDRPPFEYLMPFQSFQDQYNYFEGNPFLMPHYSDNFELTHSYKKAITNTISYTHINDVWLYYTSQDDVTKVTKNSFKNMKYNDNYSYTLFIQHTIKPWWELSASGNVAYIVYAGEVDSVSFKTTSFYFAPSLTNTFVAPKDTKIEIVALYNSAKNDGFLQMKSRWMLSLAMSKSFFNKKLDCSIAVNDLFYSYVLRTNVNFENQNWDFRATNDTRRLVVSLSYNFGKTQTAERTTSSNDEEKGRLGR